MQTTQRSPIITQIKDRFRGFLPVVVDIETSGLDAKRNALLEIAAITLTLNDKGKLQLSKSCHFSIIPFADAVIDEHSMKINGIDLTSDRGALSEHEALNAVFHMVRKEVKEHGCSRAVMVAHNGAFDLGFLNAACVRCNIKRNPFHPFATLDTASIAGFYYGQTVLAKACQMADIAFDHKQAHGARYDTEKTAELFCTMVNELSSLKISQISMPDKHSILETSHSSGFFKREHEHQHQNDSLHHE